MRLLVLLEKFSKKNSRNTSNEFFFISLHSHFVILMQLLPEFYLSSKKNKKYTENIIFNKIINEKMEGMHFFYISNHHSSSNGCYDHES